MSCFNNEACHNGSDANRKFQSFFPASVIQWCDCFQYGYLKSGYRMNINSFKRGNTRLDLSRNFIAYELSTVQVVIGKIRDQITYVPANFWFFTKWIDQRRILREIRTLDRRRSRPLFVHYSLNQAHTLWHKRLSSTLTGDSSVTRHWLSEFTDFRRWSIVIGIPSPSSPTMSLAYCSLLPPTVFVYRTNSALVNVITRIPLLIVELKS